MSARRILIVEDEILVTMGLEQLVAEMGHVVAASASGLDEAMQIARTAQLDLAILDLNIHGRASFPVAQTLRQRGIAFVFVSGYGADGLDEEFRNAPVVQKPWRPAELKRMISELLRPIPV